MYIKIVENDWLSFQVMSQRHKVVEYLDSFLFHSALRSSINADDYGIGCEVSR